MFKYMSSEVGRIFARTFRVRFTPLIDFAATSDEFRQEIDARITEMFGTVDSHYAEAHSGIVVGFDEKHPWFDQKVTPSDDMRHLVRVS